MSTPETQQSAVPVSLNYQGADPAIQLWNPNAASGWSLLFSPIFGAWLVAKNWDVLGFPDKARSNRIAAAVLLLIFLALPFTAFSDIADKATRPLGIILLLGWYFSLGKPQVVYIKEKFGTAYIRKGWGAPIGIAIGLIVAYVVFCFGVGIMLVLTGVIKV